MKTTKVISEEDILKLDKFIHECSPGQGQTTSRGQTLDCNLKV